MVEMKMEIEVEMEMDDNGGNEDGNRHGWRWYRHEAS